MLSLTPTMPILLALEPADFRRGIDALAALCQQQLKQNRFLELCLCSPIKTVQP